MSIWRSAAGLIAGCAAAILVAGTAGCGKDHKRSPAALRADADHAYNRGDYPAALADYQEYLDRKPARAYAQYGVGRTLLALNRPEEAVKHLTIAHDIEPREDLYLDELARALVLAGEPQAAIEHLRNRALLSGAIEDWLRTAETAQESGLIDEAEQALLTARTIAEPDDPRPYERLAGLYREIGDEQLELDQLRVLLHFNPDDRDLIRRVRDLGEIPGPTFSRPPAPLEG